MRGVGVAGPPSPAALGSVSRGSLSLGAEPPEKGECLMARASVFLSCRPGLRGHGLRGHGLDTTTKPTSRVLLEVCKQLFECHPVVSARVLFGEQGRCAVPFSDLICHKAAGQCQHRGAVQGGPVHPAGRGSTPPER